MATMDPREKLLQTGNELLDTIYWLESKSDDASELVKRIDAASLEDLGRDGGLIKETLNLAMEGMRMHAKRDDLTKQYTILRSTIEAMEAGRVDLPNVD